MGGLEILNAAHYACDPQPGARGVDGLLLDVDGDDFSRFPDGFGEEKCVMAVASSGVDDCVTGCYAVLQQKVKELRRAGWVTFNFQDLLSDQVLG